MGNIITIILDLLGLERKRVNQPRHDVNLPMQDVNLPRQDVNQPRQDVNLSEQDFGLSFRRKHERTYNSKYESELERERELGRNRVLQSNQALQHYLEQERSIVRHSIHKGIEEPQMYQIIRDNIEQIKKDMKNSSYKMFLTSLQNYINTKNSEKNCHLVLEIMNNISKIMDEPKHSTVPSELFNKPDDDNSEKDSLYVNAYNIYLYEVQNGGTTHNQIVVLYNLYNNIRKLD